MAVRHRSPGLAVRADRPVRVFSIVVLVLVSIGAILGERENIASSMEVGIHNRTVALTIALSVLDSTEVAIPSAVYSMLMYVLATLRVRRHEGAFRGPARPDALTAYDVLVRLSLLLMGRGGV